jgi:hypothetical protein
VNPWRPIDRDVEAACTARIDDFVLGGSSSMAIDRAAAEQLLAAVPEYPGFVLDSWTFVRRAVGVMLDAGIDQFLDLGAGIDAVGIAQELAHRSTQDARLAYVETDPVCVAQLESRVRDRVQVAVHPIDLFAVSWVLDPEAVWRLLDRDRPVGIVTASVLHYELSDDAVAAVLQRYHDGVAPGSMLAITHLSGGKDQPAAARLEEAHTKVGFPIRTRSRTSLTALMRPWTPAALTSAPADDLRLGAALLARKPVTASPALNGSTNV